MYNPIPLSGENVYFFLNQKRRNNLSRFPNCNQRIFIIIYHLCSNYRLFFFFCPQKSEPHTLIGGVQNVNLIMSPSCWKLSQGFLIFCYEETEVLHLHSLPPQTSSASSSPSFNLCSSTFFAAWIFCLDCFLQPSFTSFVHVYQNLVPISLPRKLTSEIYLVVSLMYTLITSCDFGLER